MKYITRHKFELIIICVALVVRVVMLSASIHAAGGTLPAIVGADGYFVIAQNLLAGNGYSNVETPPYTLNSIRPPAQPYFIVSLHTLTGSYWGPLLLEILLGSLIPLLGLLIAYKITRSNRIAIVVGFVMALEPLAALFSYLFYAETLCTFFFLLSILCIFEYFDTHRIRYLICAAITIGIATLAKPTVEYIPLLCALAIAWQYRDHLAREAWRIALYVGVFILVLSPWVVRNYVDFGVAGVSPQLGEQMYAVLVPSVRSINNGTTFAQEFDLVLHEGAVDPNQASIKDESTYLHKALPILAQYPKALALTFGNTALNFYIHDGWFEVLKHLGLKPQNLLGKPALFVLLNNPSKLFGYIGAVALQPAILILVGRVFWIVVTIFFFIGAAYYIVRERNVRGLLAVAIVLYFMLTTLVIGLAVTGRYRIPVQAFIYSIAVYGAVSVGKRIPWLQKRSQ